MRDEVKKIKYIQNKFRINLSILQKTKDNLFNSLQSKLEEKKIKEVKGSIYIDKTLD